MADLEYKSTIVSLVPFEMREEKPGLYPGRFTIPASNGEPQLLVVGDAVHHVYIDDTRGSLTVNDPSYEVAKAIVQDYCSSQLGADENCGPGMFWVPGVVSLNEVKTKFKDELDKAKSRQKKWFMNLVKIADDDWARYHQHRSISDFQRHAAKDLGLEREWLIVTDDSPSICPACNTKVNSMSVVCPNCKCVLKKEAFAKLTFA